MINWDVPTDLTNNRIDLVMAFNMYLTLWDKDLLSKEQYIKAIEYINNITKLCPIRSRQVAALIIVNALYVALGEVPNG